MSIYLLPISLLLIGSVGATRPTCDLPQNSSYKIY